MSKFVTLLVEDDPLQREVMADVLRSENFEVIECATGEAAELVIATSGAELRAVITDQNLEGEMLGSELAAFGRQRFPNLNIIIVSGLPKPPLPSNTQFLPKPVLPEMLIEAVRFGK